MTAPIDAKAPAKINLTLHVTGQRADGYHLLESLVVFADIADDLTLTPASEMRMSISGPFADGVPADARHLVWQAAELCGGKFDIRLVKNVPHGAGLGGGSADAAAVLRRLGHRDFALRLGADVPVCLSSTPQRMRGIGETLETLDAVPSFTLVLVNPGVHVATPTVFGALVQKSNPPMHDIPTRLDADWIGWMSHQRNDLQAAAVQVAPEIGAPLSALKDAQLVRMTGSGATCFGIFEDVQVANATAARIAAQHPEWWVRVTRTLGAPLS